MKKYVFLILLFFCFCFPIFAEVTDLPEVTEVVTTEITETEPPEEGEFATDSEEIIDTEVVNTDLSNIEKSLHHIELISFSVLVTLCITFSYTFLSRIFKDRGVVKRGL